MHRSLELSIPFLLLASLVSAATVKLGNTTLIGEDITTKGVEFFGGIPFAEPPVGNLRLRFPVLKTFLDTPTFNATTFGAGCLQTPLADIPVSEDCLTINVIRPAGIDWKPSDIRQLQLSSRSWGFPIGTEAAEKGALNLGLKDQLAALERVQQNIVAFGGDKDKRWLHRNLDVLFEFEYRELCQGRVLIIYTPLSIDSGIRHCRDHPIFNATRRQGDWDNFVAALPECKDTAPDNTFDCLRTDDVNSTHLLQAITTSLSKPEEQYPRVPTLDGPDGLLPDVPSEMLKKGQYSKIPFIAGNVIDE
ncbi:hypothetical protein MPER_12228, partial [Moniliophthora perniciosa FA553]